ncbi:MAG: hypothetical protein OXB88_02655 [Bacteriovoracales bacterium]|nr:hypothetical protein [Bacteriovoracales bacterium]
MGDLEVGSFESDGRKRETAIIVLHGYGANFKDLVPIRKSVKDDELFDWYFPNAPLSIPLGIGLEGRGWFPISIGSLGLDLTSKVPDGFQEVSEKVKSLVEEIRESHGKIYLGGFSQGAILSANVAMEWPSLVDKLFMLSGILINENRWRRCVPGVREIPTFQSHGRYDEVLPLSGAKALNEMFRKKPNHTFLEFDGGHEIPLSAQKALSEFFHG